MSRGGMRCGAGRPGHQAKAEQLQRVDVREWARRGYLRGPCSFSWTWNRGGERSGSIGVSVHGPEALTLRYTFSTANDRREVAERLTLINTCPALGGTRQWFACPRCARRAAILYLRGGYFGCRVCKRVAYSSQSEGELDRLWRRQRRIEARLGEHWRRPKGMRHRTHQRLIDHLLKLEERREDALVMWMGRLNFHF